MTAGADRAAAWVYQGVWAGLVKWLRVPDHAPELPVGENVRVSRPAPGFLSYLKFKFWLALLPLDIALLIAWLVIFAVQPLAGILLTAPVLFLAIAPDIVAYIALHLRFDTTWYALSDRSMRIRRGLWVINETTITYENIQNVTVNQGPVQRYFGIADVLVQTAGGGSGGKPGHESMTHLGLIEGIADASAVRDLIMARVKASRSAGLGDEHHGDHAPPAATVSGWTTEQLAMLREIGAIAARVAGG